MNVEGETIFVSPDGSDVVGDGTRAHPFKTLTTMLSKVVGQRRRVYACGARYEEMLYLNPEHAGLVFVGGIDCATWKANGARLVVLAPIRIDPAEQPIVIEGIEVVAPPPYSPPIEPGGFGIPERTSMPVATVGTETTFRRVRFVGPAALEGVAGRSQVWVPPPMAASHVRQPMGATGGYRSCSGVTTVGSNGGSGPGGSGVPGGTPNGGLADVPCASGGDGKPGVAGANGSAGTGATSYGQFSSNGFAPRPGGNGQPGEPGQGGGGGGNGTAPQPGIVGGGGGAGGCANIVFGGGGGGASIAITALNVKVTLRESIIETQAAANGGAGAGSAAGAMGQTAGAGFNGACSGGVGGPSGATGASGGGAGGVSIGVVYTGVAPDIDAATKMTLGGAGKGGAGGIGTNAGIDGVSAPTLEIKP